ncbi:pyridoxal-phosphate dependent enzyme [Paraburkholderia acidicola]|uniref:Pyridoxal-phosphate dependent enzyme n=1 Tax=Paraburkholderia acidicola TaxID=1912599 RepID=A0ABV1LWW8_9BURK
MTSRETTTADAPALPSLTEILRAKEKILPYCCRTPLVRLEVEGIASQIYLKLEGLQPIGAFKLRAAVNAIVGSDLALRSGVCTASTGNMAQGVAWIARHLGIPARVIVPRGTDQVKLASARRMGAEIHLVSPGEWWTIMTTHEIDDKWGYFVHPVANNEVIAGNATIFSEIIEDLPDVDTVIAPFGGGGLLSGLIAGRNAFKPDTRIIGCESDAATPLTHAIAASGPVRVTCTPSFVTGMGSPIVLEEMWPLISSGLNGCVDVSQEAICNAIRVVFERVHVVAEGAGAAPVAAALAGKVTGRTIACVVSGANIDAEKFISILSGDIPQPATTANYDD